MFPPNRMKFQIKRRSSIQDGEGGLDYLNNFSSFDSEFHSPHEGDSAYYFGLIDITREKNEEREMPTNEPISWILEVFN